MKEVQGLLTAMRMGPEWLVKVTILNEANAFQTMATR